MEPRIDAWPEPKQMSEVVERFLQLPDSGDYTRVRQFNIDAKGAVISRGDSFRRKRQTAGTPTSVETQPNTQLTQNGECWMGFSRGKDTKGTHPKRKSGKSYGNAFGPGR